MIQYLHREVINTNTLLSFSLVDGQKHWSPILKFFVWHYKVIHVGICDVWSKCKQLTDLIILGTYSEEMFTPGGGGGMTARK